jgi:hypothetical protein
MRDGTDTLKDDLQTFSDALQIPQPDSALIGRLAVLASVELPPKAFGSTVRYLIIKAHEAEALSNAPKIPHKRIAHHARELAALLKAANARHLVYLIEPESVNVDDIISALDELSFRCRNVNGVIKGRRIARGVNAERHEFVETLLENVHRARGRLTLDSRREGGSLVEFVELLKPFLPKEISDKLSFSTLRRIYDAWLKTGENSPQKSKL